MSSNKLNGTPLKKDVSPTPDNSNKSVNPMSSMSNAQKWIAALFLGLLFAIVSSPAMYSVTSYFTSEGTLYKTGGGATMGGLLLHTLVFVLLVRLVMW